MSFFLDWWMLIGLGMVITLLERIIRQLQKEEHHEDSFFVYTMSILVLVVFYSLSVGLFCELGWSAEWGFDNPVFGRANELFFNMVRTMPGFDDYYLRHPYASSTDFMFSSGYEFLKSGLGGNWFTNWIGGMFGFEVPFDRLMPWYAYEDFTVLVPASQSGWDFDVTVAWLQDFVDAYPNWATMADSTPVTVNGTNYGTWGALKDTLLPVLTAEGLAQHPMFLFGGVIMFATYPGFLYMGTQLGYMLWGRKKGDLGVLGLL